MAGDVAAAAEGGLHAGPRLSDAVFRRFQVLVRRESGIALNEGKKALVESRLGRRLRELALDFGAYCRLVEDDVAERDRMIDDICTNETHFFREPRQFEFLETRVVGEWVARAGAGTMPRRARLWSAACSTGEEPYSLAMSVLSTLPAASGWSVEILATDLSRRALDRARAAVWPLERAREIPRAHLEAFMWKGVRSEAGRMKAGAEARSVLRFDRLNLTGDHLPPGPFDVIFCRNVLIYFDVPTKLRVLEALAACLDPLGYLFLGQAEAAMGLPSVLRSVGGSVYVHASRPRA